MEGDKPIAVPLLKIDDLHELECKKDFFPGTRVGNFLRHAGKGHAPFCGQPMNERRGLIELGRA